MNFVDSIRISDIDIKENPCMKGEGIPTSQTKANVGFLYMDTLTGEIYKCVSIGDDIYRWDSINSGTLFVESTAETIELVNNNEYQFGEITSLTMTLPTDIPNGYISGVVFTSGASIPVLTISGEYDVKFDGEDCLDGSFVPQTNKIYQIFISKVRNEIWADVDSRGV